MTAPKPGTLTDWALKGPVFVVGTVFVASLVPWKLVIAVALAIVVAGTVAQYVIHRREVARGEAPGQLESPAPPESELDRAVADVTMPLAELVRIAEESIDPPAKPKEASKPLPVKATAAQVRADAINTYSRMSHGEAIRAAVNLPYGELTEGAVAGVAYLVQRGAGSPQGSQQFEARTAWRTLDHLVKTRDDFPGRWNARRVVEGYREELEKPAPIAETAPERSWNGYQNFRYKEYKKFAPIAEAAPTVDHRCDYCGCLMDMNGKCYGVNCANAETN